MVDNIVISCPINLICKNLFWIASGSLIISINMKTSYSGHLTEYYTRNVIGGRKRLVRELQIN